QLVGANGPLAYLWRSLREKCTLRVLRKTPGRTGEIVFRLHNTSAPLPEYYFARVSRGIGKEPVIHELEPSTAGEPVGRTLRRDYGRRLAEKWPDEVKDWPDWERALAESRPRLEKFEMAYRQGDLEGLLFIAASLPPSLLKDPSYLGARVEATASAARRAANA